MPAELEQFTTDSGLEVTAFAFTGARNDIWHRLGQSFDGRAMTAEEAMRESHMNRLIRVMPVVPPGSSQWAVPEHYFIVLEGDTFITPENEFVTVPDKVVGIHGKGGADAHGNFTIRDRFLLAEEAIHASHEQAVWSTAGSLRDGTQGFATMLAPPIVIDPHGIADVINQYLTIVWSFDGSRATELGSSEIRVVCANTLAMHDGGQARSSRSSTPATRQSSDSDSPPSSGRWPRTRPRRSNCGPNGCSRSAASRTS